MKKVRQRLLIVLFAACVVSGVRCPAQESAAYSVQSVKAAFLYRFLEYVEWPAGTRADRPLTIAVLGDEDLTTELHRSVRGRTAHGREVRVRAVMTLSEGLDADVLFVGPQFKKRLNAFAGSHEREPVLVVTEGDGALESGSVINFLVVDGNVRFEVSLPAAEQRGLKLSSRLLSVALRVEKSGHRWGQPVPASSDEPYFVRQPHAGSVERHARV